MAIRQIILLRHAHAEPPARDQDDEARPLTDGGQREAAAAAAWLVEHALKPDVVLCSPALRTRGTASVVAAALGAEAGLRIDERIYEATPATLIGILDEYADADSLLLVGHNPGLETLVALLTDGTSDSGRGMPPGSIAWLHLDHDAALEPGAASLRHFWWP